MAKQPNKKKLSFKELKEKVSTPNDIIKDSIGAFLSGDPTADSILSGKKKVKTEANDRLQFEIKKAPEAKPESNFIGDAANTIYHLLTNPLNQAGQQINQGIGDIGRAFTPQGNAGQGVSDFLGGLAKLGSSPFTATLGYINELINPVAQAADKSGIGQMINKLPGANTVNNFLTRPATTTMEALSKLTGLQPPSKGALELGDLLGSLEMFTFMNKNLPKGMQPPDKATPNLPELKLSKERIKELNKEAIAETQAKDRAKAAKMTNLQKAEKEAKQNAPKETTLEKAVKEQPAKKKTPLEKADALKEVEQKLGLKLEKEAPKPESKKAKVEQPKAIDNIPPLNEAETKKVKLKTMGTFAEGITLNSPKLGDYANEKLPTTEVMNGLKQHGLVEEAVKMARSLSKGERNEEVKGATFETVGRVMLKNADELVSKREGQTGAKAVKPTKIPKTETQNTPSANSPINDIKKKEIKIEPATKPEPKPKPKPKVKVKKAKAKPVEEQPIHTIDRIIDHPINELPENLKKRVEVTAQEMRDELERAEIKRTGSFHEGRIGSTTMSTFPEWFSGLRRTRAHVLAAFDKILDPNIQEKGKLVSQLKSFAVDRMMGNQQDVILNGSSGKFKRDVVADIPADKNFVDFLNTHDKPMTKAELHAEFGKTAETSFNPGIDFPESGTETLQKYLKEKDSYKIGDIAEQTGFTEREISDKMKVLTSNKFVEEYKNDKGEKYYKPTEEFKILLDDVIKDPLKYDEDFGKLFSNPLPQIVKGLTNALKTMDDLIERFVGRPIYNKAKAAISKVTPEKLKEQIITNYGLPEFYLKLKQDAKDAIDRYNEIAKEMAGSLTYKSDGTKFTPAEQKRLAHIIRGSVTTNSLLKARADRAIREIKQLEKLGKELEVLPDETYNTKLPRKRIAKLLEEIGKAQEKLNKGHLSRRKEIENTRLIELNKKKIKNSFKHGGEGYFKRVYLTKEQEKIFKRYGYTQPTRLDLTSAIGRKDIPYDVRKKMGEVLTAAYPVSKGIMLEGKDVSLGTFFKALNEHPDYVSEYKQPNFVKMDKNPKLGKLSGKWVEKRIAADINDVVKMTSPEYMDGFLKEINSIWKATKTIMNPATHGRNIMSNSIMLDFSGVSQLDQIRILPKAIEAMRGKGEWAADFKASRLKETTFLKQELNQYLDIVGEKKLNFSLDPLEMITKAYGKLSLVDTKVGRKLGDLYQMEETLGKAIKFIAERENGKSIAEARAEANKWLFDYSEIPKAVNFLRTNPLIGKPFVTWSYKAFPRIIETAITRPISFWKYPVIFHALSNYAISKLGMTKKEWNDIRGDFSKHLAQGSWLLLPYRDNNGHMQMLDLTYIMPYKDIFDMLQASYNFARTSQLEKGDNIATTFAQMIDAPVTTMISELQSNMNNYSGLPIVPDNATPTEAWQATTDYLYKLYMPALAPQLPFGLSKGGYSYHKLASTIVNNEDYYDRNFTVSMALLSSFAGLKTTPVEPKKVRQQKYYRLNKKVVAWAKKKSKIKRDRTLTPKEKGDKIKRIDIAVGKLKKEMDKTGYKP